LIRHLTGEGFDVGDLVDAGLARERDRGGRMEWVDHFRDRVVWPIRNQAGELVGFIGRRNPTKQENGGPKYLNTRATAAFTKGDQLFGMHEASTAVRAGAQPVLAEGPLDALAVTLTTGGRAVGVAPLGTALTWPQTEQLAWASVLSRQPVVVATDGDDAGWRAAEHDFWALTLADLEPNYLTVPAGTDPAAWAATQPHELMQALDSARPLGDMLIRQQLASTARANTPVDRDEVSALARLVSAQPVERWQPSAAMVAAALGMRPARLLTEVVQESIARDRERFDRDIGR
jgi:DNA primase catalytic core